MQDKSGIEKSGLHGIGYRCPGCRRIEKVEQILHSLLRGGASPTTAAAQAFELELRFRIATNKFVSDNMEIAHREIGDPTDA